MLSYEFIVFLICLSGTKINGVDINGSLTSGNDLMGKIEKEIEDYFTYETLSQSKAFQSGRTIVKGDYWPNGIVYYDFDDVIKANQNHQDVLVGAFKEYERSTCLQFKPYDAARMGPDENRVKIITSGGCWSILGFIGGEQPMALEPSCINHRTVLHEFGHALGLIHEHTRPDRDDYVTVHVENIRSPAAKFTYTKSTDVIDPITPYDYLSVMHYPPKANGMLNSQGRKKIVLEPKDECYLPLLGRARTLSYYDIKLLNFIYKCNVGCESTVCPDNAYARQTTANPKCHCHCLDDSNNPCKGGSCFVGDRYSNCEELARNNYKKWCNGSRENYEYCCDTCSSFEDQKLNECPESTGFSSGNRLPNDNNNDGEDNLDDDGDKVQTLAEDEIKSDSDRKRWNPFAGCFWLFALLPVFHRRY